MSSTQIPIDHNYRIPRNTSISMAASSSSGSQHPLSAGNGNGAHGGGGFSTVLHALPALPVHSHHVAEVLRAVFSSLIFSRSLGALTPSLDASSLFPDLVYPSLSYDARSQRQLDAAVRRVCESIEDAHAAGKLADGQRWHVAISFYERRPQSPRPNATPTSSSPVGSWGSWFLGNSPSASSSILGVARTERSLSNASAWETWTLPLDLFTSTTSVSAELGVALRRTLGYVCERVNEHLDHIPPVTSRDALSYPFDITAAPAHSSAKDKAHDNGDGRRDSMGRERLGLDVVRRLLASTPPKGDLL